MPNRKAALTCELCARFGTRTVLRPTHKLSRVLESENRTGHFVEYKVCRSCANEVDFNARSEATERKYNAELGY